MFRFAYLGAYCIAFGSIFLGGELRAQESVESGKPPYCEYYRNINSDLYVDQLQEDQLTQVIYKFPHLEGVQITLGDLKKWRYYGFQHTLPTNAKVFQKKMFYLLNLINIENKARYYASLDIPETKKSEEDLNQCLQKDFYNRKLVDLNRSISQLTPSTEAYKGFIDSHFFAALKIRSLFEKKASLEQEFLAAKTKLQDRYRFRLERGRYPLYNKEKKELEDLEQASVFYVMQDFYKLAGDFPSLVKLDTQWGATGITEKLAPSRFQEELLKLVDEDIVDALVLRLSLEGDFSSLTDIILDPEVQKILDQNFEAIYSNSFLKEVAREEVERSLLQLNESILRTCEEKGSKLHYSQELVETSFRQNTKSFDYKALTIRDQAAYCHLVEKDSPFDAEAMGKREKLGYYTLGTASVLSLFNGYGRSVTSLLGVSSWLLVDSNWDKFIVNEVKRDAYLFMVHGAYSSMKEVEEASQKRWDILGDATLDLAAGLGGVATVAAVDRSVSLFLAKKYVNLKKSVSSKTPDFVSVFDVFLRAKAKQGLKWDRSDWAREKFYALERSREYLFRRLEKKYSLITRTRVLSSRASAVRGHYDIPAYYIYANNKKVTLEQIDALLSSKVAKTPRGKELINMWILDVAKHQSGRDLLRHNIDQTFNSAQQIPILKAYRKKLSPMDFEKGRSLDLGDLGKLEDGVLEIRLPRKLDGRNATQKLTINRYNQIEREIDERKRALKNSLSNSIYAEFFHRSNLSKTSLLEASNHNLYGLLIKRMENLGSKNTLSSLQKKALEKMKEAVKLEPNYEDLMRVFARDIYYEGKDFFFSLLPNGKKFRFGNKGLDPEQLASQIQYSSPVFDYFKTLVIGGGSTVVAKWIYDLSGQGGFFHRNRELLFQSWRDTQRWWADYTSTERECAEEVRQIAFDTCFYKLAVEEMGYFIALKKGDKAKYFHRNREATERMQEFVYRMLYLRKISMVAEAREYSREVSKSIEERFFAEVLGEEVRKLLKKNGVEDEIIDGLIYGLFFDDDVNDGRIYFHELLSQKYSGNIFQVLSSAVKRKKEILDKMIQSGDLPGDIVDFIESANKISDSDDDSGFLKIYYESYKSSQELLKKDLEREQQLLESLKKENFLGKTKDEKEGR